MSFAIMADTPRKLPVWAVITRSYSYVWERRGFFAIPVALLFLAQIAADILLRSPAATGGGHPGVGLILGAICGFLGKLAISMAFAVGVHRTVLLDEEVGGVSFFRFGDGFWRYLGASLMLIPVGLCYALAMVAIGVVLGLGTAGAMKAIGGGGGVALSGVLMLAGLAGYFAATARFMSLWLSLPAAAVGGDRGLVSAWHAGRGNGWRLFGAFMLSALPFIIGSVIVQAPHMIDVIASVTADPHAKPPPLGLGTIIANSLIVALLTPVMITVLSLCYDVLVRGGGPQPGQA